MESLQHGRAVRGTPPCGDDHDISFPARAEVNPSGGVVHVPRGLHVFVHEEVKCWFFIRITTVA